MSRINKKIKHKRKTSITHIMKIVQLMDISSPITASWLIGDNLILKYNCDLNWIGNELPCNVDSEERKM